MKTLTHRQVLIELLRTHNDARTAWDTRAGGGGPVLMPSPYHEGSYQELEHRLAQMRDDPMYRRRWWHLSQRYRWGITHREVVPCRRTRQGPVPRLRAHTELVSQGEVHGQRMACIVYEWCPEVNPYYVEQALDRLLATMHGGRAYRIRLPLAEFQRAIGVAPDERSTRAGAPTLPLREQRATLVA